MGEVTVYNVTDPVKYAEMMDDRVPKVLIHPGTDSTGNDIVKEVFRRGAAVHPWQPDTLDELVDNDVITKVW